MDSLKGQLLAASPQLLDDNFDRTVVLMIEHGEEGAFGLVINRSAEQTVGQIWHELGDADCANPQPVYLGGPVTGPLIALHGDRTLAEMKISEGVFFAAKKESLDQLVHKDDGPLKIFVGHSGWGAGQLESELAAGAWLPTPATAEYVFGDDVGLWEEVARQHGHLMLQSILKLKHIPDDPSLN